MAKTCRGAGTGFPSDACSSGPVASLTVPALSISGLSVAYDDAIVVGDVDARFLSGTMTAIIGPNGAGKSSLLKATLGIVPKLAGHVAFFGEPLDTMRDWIRGLFGGGESRSAPPAPPALPPGTLPPVTTDDAPSVQFTPMVPPPPPLVPLTPATPAQDWAGG